MTGERAVAAVLGAVRGAIRQDGFTHLAPEVAMPLLLEAGLADWAGFAASWDRLEPDRFMSDGGRYRRRRHAVYRLDDAPSGPVIERCADRPHFQPTAFNRLNGGIDRSFAPVEPAIGAHPALLAALGCARLAFAPVDASAEVPDRSWEAEVHQFRIEAIGGKTGQPTPEGAHRDGVDFVLVMMIGRVNIASGTTSILDPVGRTLGSFTLSAPRETVLIDDRRCLHGVTPVRALDPARPAFRDVLVVTLRAATITGPA